MTFDVVKANGQLTLLAGEIHGITPGTEFDVYASEVFSVREQLLGHFVVQHAGSTSSSLSGSQDDLQRVQEGLSVATPTSRLQHTLSLHIPRDDVRNLAARSLDSESPEDQHGRSQINANGSRDEADLIVATTSDGQLCFLHPPTNETCKLGLRQLTYTMPQDPPSMRRVFRAAAKFFLHLRNEPSQKMGLKDRVRVRIYELNEADKRAIVGNRLVRIIEPKSLHKEYGIDSGPVEVVAAEAGAKPSSAPRYGVALANTFDSDLFVWMFLFDCSTFAICTSSSPSDIFSHYSQRIIMNHEARKEQHRLTPVCRAVYQARTLLRSRSISSTAAGYLFSSG